MGRTGEWLAFSPGVVAGLSLAVETFTSPGDQIVIQPPVYHPFFAVIERNERVLVQNELVVEGGQYRIDFADLERKFAQGAKTMIFCSPHNPVGRVWTETELQQLAELVKQYGGIGTGRRNLGRPNSARSQPPTLASLNEDIASRCITFMAPSKTFNVAGFHLSNVIIRNDELRERYCKTMQRLSLGGMNAFGVRGAEAAYRHCAPWLDELRDYLKGNVEYTLAELEKRMPAIKVLPPEGTYLLWLDCRALPIPPDKLEPFPRNRSQGRPQ